MSELIAGQRPDTGEWFSVFYNPPKPGETVMFWSSKWDNLFWDDRKSRVVVGYYDLVNHKFVFAGEESTFDVPNTSDWAEYIPELWYRIPGLPVPTGSSPASGCGSVIGSR